MALPSQQERGGGNRSSIHAQPREKAVRPRAVIGLAAVVVMGGVVTWGVYKIASGGGSDEPKSGEPAATASGPNVDVPVRFGAVEPPETTPPASNLDTPRPAPVDVLSTTPQSPEGTTPPTPPPGTLDGAPTPLAPTASISEVRTLIDQGDRALAQNEPVQAREFYSKALLDPSAARADQESLRSKLQSINQQLVFSATITPGDPFVEAYTVQPGDSLVRIARRRELTSDWRLIQRLNGIGDPNSIRVGQKLKLVRGPFNAIVNKSDFRLDVFMGPPDVPAQWVYVRSFRVGLGAENGTPAGTFVVRKNSKLADPAWTNPLTGERFASDDPKNPVGEHWIGWQGVGDSAVYTGFGIHGTIDPDSVGQQRSMGCVRMLADDVALVFENCWRKRSAW